MSRTGALTDPLMPVAAMAAAPTQVRRKRADLRREMAVVQEGRTRPSIRAEIATVACPNMQYDVPQDATNGFTLSADCRTATLNGSVCDLSKGAAYSRISFEYGCVGAPPLPSN